MRTLPGVIRLNAAELKINSAMLTKIKHFVDFKTFCGF